MWQTTISTHHPAYLICSMLPALFSRVAGTGRLARINECIIILMKHLSILDSQSIYGGDQILIFSSQQQSFTAKVASGQHLLFGTWNNLVATCLSSKTYLCCISLNVWYWDNLQTLIAVRKDLSNMHIVCDLD